jgi:hypothetical protein
LFEIKSQKVINSRSVYFVDENNNETNINIYNVKEDVPPTAVIPIDNSAYLNDKPIIPSSEETEISLTSPSEVITHVDPSVIDSPTTPTPSGLHYGKPYVYEPIFTDALHHNDIDARNILDGANNTRHTRQSFQDRLINSNYAKHTNEINKSRAFKSFMRQEEPLTLSEAKLRPDWDKWEVAYDLEMKAIFDMGTLTECVVPPGEKYVGSKLVFKIKRHADGTIERYKVRLVAKGYSQIEGYNFFETTSPVAEMQSVKLFLCIAASNDLYVEHTDVDTAFLIPELKEKVWIKLPNGKTYLLNKTLYGLKQSSREWNKEADKNLRSIGFTPLLSDPCIYTRKDKDGRTFYLALFVDDILLAHHNLEDIKTVQRDISRFWKTKNFGPVTKFLGLSIHRNYLTKSIHLSQEELLKECLKITNLSDCNPAVTPFDHEIKLQKATDNDKYLSIAEKEIYQSIVGKLFYVSNNTRPDLCTAVSMVSSYVSNPTAEHMAAVKRILRYCKGTLTLGIQLGGEHNALPLIVGYSDADWAGDLDTRRSRTGYTFHIGSGCITWHSKKQATVALSTAEAEYMSLSSATQELKWLRCLLDELGFPQEITEMNQDNKSCIQITHSHQRSKHIDIRHHFIKDEINLSNMKMNWCPTKDMVADIMTKPLPRPRFIELRDKLNVKSIDQFLTTIEKSVPELHVKLLMVTDELARSPKNHIKEAVNVNKVTFNDMENFG